MNERAIGAEILKVENISLSFGVMKVLDNISFDIRQGEIRSIIGPNGAGKSSMLNVINGFYHPQQGSITFKGETRKQMAPHVAASHGIARTFQNIALFSTSRRFARSRSVNCPTVCRSGSSWGVRLPPNQSCCCLMNPWPE